MDHAPSPLPLEHVGTADAATRRHAAWGLRLFVIYALLYGLFMVLNAFVPSAMAWMAFDGINLAVAYGLGLIVAAFGLALVYAWLCRTPPAGKPK
jgi:uncharacterized membrane protein YedE/YeeE